MAESVVIADLLAGVSAEPGSLQKLEGNLQRQLEQIAQKLAINIPINFGEGKGGSGGGVPRLPPQLLSDIQKLSNEAATLRNQFQGGLIGPEVANRLREIGEQAKSMSAGLEVGSRELRQLSQVGAQTERTLAGISGEASKLGIASQVTTGILNSVRGALAGIAAVAVGGGLLGISQSLQDVSLEAAKAANAATIFEGTIRNAGLGSSAANQLVTELAERYRVLPSVVQEASTQLIRNGATIQQVKGILEGGAASALAFGKSVQSGFENIAQATVSLTSAQLNQIGISENLGPALDKYAKSLGKTADDLTRAEQTTAVYNLVLQATGEELKNVDTILGGYIGANAEAEKAAAKFGQTVGQIVSPAITTFKQGFADLLNLLSDSPGVLIGFTAAATSAATALAAFKITEIITGLGGLIPALNAARTALITTFTAGGPIVLGVVALSAAIGVLIGQIYEANRAVQEQEAAWKKLENQTTRTGIAATIASLKLAQSQNTGRLEEAQKRLEEAEARVKRTLFQQGLTDAQGNLRDPKFADIANQYRTDELAPYRAEVERLTDSQQRLNKQIAEQQQLMARLRAEEQSSSESRQQSTQTTTQLIARARELVKAQLEAQKSGSAEQIISANRAIENFTKNNKAAAEAVNAVRIELQRQAEAQRKVDEARETAAKNIAQIRDLDEQRAFREKVTKAIDDENIALLRLLKSQYLRDEAAARAKNDAQGVAEARAKIQAVEAGITEIIGAQAKEWDAFRVAQGNAITAATSNSSGYVQATTETQEATENAIDALEGWTDELGSLQERLEIFSTETLERMLVEAVNESNTVLEAAILAILAFRGASDLGAASVRDLAEQTGLLADELARVVELEEAIRNPVNEVLEDVVNQVELNVDLTVDDEGLRLQVGLIEDLLASGADFTAGQVRRLNDVLDRLKKRIDTIAPLVNAPGPDNPFTSFAPRPGQGTGGFNLLPVLVNADASLPPGFTPAFVKILEETNNEFAELKNTGESAANTLARVTRILQENRDALENTRLAGGNANAAILDQIDGLQQLELTLEPNTAAWRALRQEIERLRAALKTLDRGDRVAEFINGQKGFAPNAADFIPGLVKIPLELDTTNLLKSLENSGALRDAKKFITDEFKGFNLAGLLGNISGIASSAGALLTGQGDIFGLANSIADILPPGISSIAKPIIAIVETITDTVSSLVIGANAKISESLRQTFEGLKGFGVQYGGELEKLRQRGLEAAGNAGNFFTNLFDKPFADLEARTAKGIQRTLETAQRLASDIPGAISSALLDGLKNGDFSAAGEALESKLFENIVGKIIETATAAALSSGVIAGKLVDLTKTVEQAVASGNYSNVAGSVRDIVQSARTVFNQLASSLGSGLAGLFPETDSGASGVTTGRRNAVVVDIPRVTGEIAAPSWTGVMNRTADTYSVAVSEFGAHVRSFGQAVLELRSSGNSRGGIGPARTV